MLTLTDETIHETIEKGRFLLMFYTEWCPLCPPVIEMLQELEETESEKFQFLRINFDENPGADAAFGAKCVPLVFAVADGKILMGFAGLMDKSTYRDAIYQVLRHEEEPAIQQKILLNESVPQ